MWGTYSSFHSSKSNFPGQRSASWQGNGGFLPFLLCELLFSCSPWTSASQASLSFTMS